MTTRSTHERPRLKTLPGLSRYLANKAPAIGKEARLSANDMTENELQQTQRNAQWTVALSMAVLIPLSFGPSGGYLAIYPSTLLGVWVIKRAMVHRPKIVCILGQRPGIALVTTGASVILWDHVIASSITTFIAGATITTFIVWKTAITTAAWQLTTVPLFLQDLSNEEAQEIEQHPDTQNP